MKNQPKALLFGTCLAIAGMMLSPGRGMAQNIQLSDEGSTAQVNLGAGTGGTGLIGMNSWEVGTGNQMQNELNQQWFWYRIGTGPVQSIDMIGGLTVNQYGQLNYLDANYNNGQIEFDITYSLTGGGVNSGSADIQETVNAYNVSGSAFNLEVFEYSNFNLLDESENTIQLSGNPGSGYTEAYQSLGGTAIAEGIINPNANSAEANTAAATLAQVEAGNLLGDTFAPAGNNAWAFGWTANNLAANGGNLSILKDKELSVSTVPEPSTFALAALGLGACGWIRRRRMS